MSIDLSIPISTLGPIYSNFEDAPLGTLLAFHEPVATGRANTWNHTEGLRVAMRIETPAGPALQVISPAPMLVFSRQAARTQMAMFDEISIASGPAVDLGTTYRATLAAIAPKGRAQNAQLAPGDVAVVAGDDPVRLLVAIDYPGYANRLAIIRGEGIGTVVDIGSKAVITVGKLAVEPLPAKR